MVMANKGRRGEELDLSQQWAARNPPDWLKSTIRKCVRQMNAVNLDEGAVAVEEERQRRWR